MSGDVEFTRRDAALIGFTGVVASLNFRSIIDLMEFSNHVLNRYAAADAGYRHPAESSGVLSSMFFSSVIGVLPILAFFGIMWLVWKRAENHFPGLKAWSARSAIKSS